MFDFIYNNPIALIDGVEYEVYEFQKSAPNSVAIYFKNEEYK